MEPLKLLATCKDYIWGGNKLRTEFNQESPLPRLAESWLLSCHKDGPSVIVNGPFAGRALPEYLEQAGPGVLGSRCAQFDFFPVLIKLIDAKDRLSVQVHPDDEYAMRVEGEYGKTEMWYVLDAEPGAFLYYGLEKPVAKPEFRAKIDDGTLLELLHPVTVEKGDVLFIEAGTLHAIGAGLVIAEIQQNSNTTYRVFDYGRGRPLQVDKALDVAQLKPAGPPEQRDGYEITLLAKCAFFTVHRLAVQTAARLTAGSDSFHSLLCVEGQGVLRTATGEMPLRKGDSLFLPAGMGDYNIAGQCQLLLTQV